MQPRKLTIILDKQKNLIVTGQIDGKTISEAFYLKKSLGGKVVWKHSKTTLKKKEAHYKIAFALRRVNRDEFKNLIVMEGVDQFTTDFATALFDFLRQQQINNLEQIQMDCSTVDTRILNSALVKPTDALVQMSVRKSEPKQKTQQPAKLSSTVPATGSPEDIILGLQVKLQITEAELKELKENKENENKKTIAKKQGILWLKLMVQLIAVRYAAKPGVLAKLRAWRGKPPKFNLKEYDKIFKDPRKKVSLKMDAVLKLLVGRFTDFLGGNKKINNKLLLASSQHETVQFNNEHYTGRLAGKLLQKIIALSKDNGPFSVFKDVIDDNVSSIQGRLNAANLDFIGQTTLRDEFPDFIEQLNDISPIETDKVRSKLRAIEFDVDELLHKQEKTSNESFVRVDSSSQLGFRASMQYE